MSIFRRKPQAPNRNELPFHETLSPASELSDSRVFRLNEMPDKVVRLWPTLRGSEIIAKENETPSAQLERDLTALRRAKEFFERLGDDHHIAVPAIDYVVGKDEGGVETLFTVVDRIEGTNLAAKELPAEALQPADAALADVARHYMDAYQTDAPYWRGLSPEQFIFGRRSGEITDRVYIVDIDPEIGQFKNDTSPREKAQHLLQLSKNHPCRRGHRAGIRLPGESRASA